MIRDLWEEDPERIRSYHDEQRRLATTFFKFSENGDPCSFASGAAEVLWKYPPEEVLSTSLLGDFDEGLFGRYIGSFTPENCVITVSSPKIDTAVDHSPSAEKITASRAKWEVEPLYNNPYRQAPLGEDVVKELKQGSVDPMLKLTNLNPFVPEDFDLVLPSGDRVTPESVVKASSSTSSTSSPPPALPPTPLRRPGVDLYYKNTALDFAVPKTVFYAHLTSPSCYATPRSMTLARAFERVLREDLNERSYDASVAGCNFSVNVHPSGIRIVISGWSEAAGPLLSKVVGRAKELADEMSSHGGDDTPMLRSFATQVEGLRIETENFKLDPPYELANYNSRLLLEENVWTVEQYLKEIPGLTIRDCGELAKSCLSGVAINALCMGSVDAKGAEAMVETVESVATATLEPEDFPRFRSLRLPSEAEAAEALNLSAGEAAGPLVYQAVASDEESNHAVEFNLQAGCEEEVRT